MVAFTNFLIIDAGKLTDYFNNQSHKLDDDGYYVLNSDEKNDECVFEQGKPYSRKPGNLLGAVLYRCHEPDGQNCTIKNEDKLKLISYWLHVGYNGYNLQHQNSDKPLDKLKKGQYWLKNIPFLEGTNIALLNWQITKYEEKKGIFGKLYDEIVGNKNTYYGGDYKSFVFLSDDGHVRNMTETIGKIKDSNGNHFIILLLFLTETEHYEYEQYSRKEISFFDALANVFALSSTVLNLMSLAYAFLYSQNYNNYKIIENILTQKYKLNIKKR